MLNNLIIKTKINMSYKKSEKNNTKKANYKLNITKIIYSVL